ncbi:penicillin-binding protein, 1A family [Chloroherpeton thalassium ATCC 35110]|uniref:Penicillin-binding protein, 1A family n=1 Tax=Chloroherpeton thalassium (strain ATCC 35110 / GB-78) TaxID=517418 RepID=B3QYF5_CHLT3|nr:PBP1A family penicillin-binding protein [Chloroherpeton thalassium]ACF13583.1 penicillin-binding protein, 1A family [Chloroherpeton thalassium ATCC 35110]
MPKNIEKNDDAGNGHSSKEREAYFHNPEYRKKVARRNALMQRIYLGFLAMILLGALGIGGIMLYLSQDLPSLEQLENPKPELATTVYSADGKLLSKYFLKNRTSVPLDSISVYARQALIATEDVEFYDHWGFNSRRFVAAMIENIITMRSRWHGASTVTQQLARNLYLTHDRTVSRKLKEFLTAIQIERTYTKDEILWLYLNTVYFGSGAWGIEAAAWTYFDKPAIDLDVAESAVLVGTLKSPRDYDPVREKENSLARRNLIIGLMAKAGFLTEQEAETEKAKALVTHFTSVTDVGDAPYYTEYIRRQLKQEAKKYGFDIYRDGLTVYTSLDTRMQKYAEDAVAEHLPWVQDQFDKDWRWPTSLKNDVIRESPRFQELREQGMTEKEALAKLKNDKEWLRKLLLKKTAVEVGFIAIEPATGHIKAWVGGKDFRKDDYQYQFDHVWQARRQPGSTFKPFVYTAAIDAGIPPNYQLLNQPLVIKDDDRIWTPENSDLESGGLTTLRDALKNSLNQVTIRLVNESVPPSKIIEYARRMGIKSPLDENYSIALGTSVVSPLELCSAYSTFANNGVHVEPVSILRIEDKFGQPIVTYKPDRAKALDPETNYVMVSMLKGVINGGTGVAVRSRYKFYEDAGGKTGTTQDNKDAWFAGFTPQLAAVVWTGFDDERIKYTSMKYGQGARASLPIWANFMTHCYADPELGLQSRYFKKPAKVIGIPISSRTNLPADANDNDAYIEYFTEASWKQYQSSLNNYSNFNRLDTLGGNRTARAIPIAPPQKKRGEGQF